VVEWLKGGCIKYLKRCGATRSREGIFPEQNELTWNVYLAHTVCVLTSLAVLKMML
jgi:hypothetical protein